MDKELFAQRLTELRINKGVSARDMSLSIGQSAGYINNIENGVNLPSMTVFFYICEYLGIEPKDFFDTDTQDILTRNGAIYSRWKDIKPFVRSIIRGKLLPLHLKVVFCLSESQLSVLTDSNIILSTDTTGIQGYFLNIQYRNHSLLCTTGIARETFTMDKKPEQFWDELVLSFFRHLDIDFENL